MLDRVEEMNGHEKATVVALGRSIKLMVAALLHQVNALLVLVSSPEGAKALADRAEKAAEVISEILEMREERQIVAAQALLTVLAAVVDEVTAGSPIPRMAVLMGHGAQDGRGDKPW